MGGFLLCILLFVAGLGFVLGGITLASHYLLEAPDGGTKDANKR